MPQAREVGAAEREQSQWRDECVVSFVQRDVVGEKEECGNGSVQQQRHNAPADENPRRADVTADRDPLHVYWIRCAVWRVRSTGDA